MVHSHGVRGGVVNLAPMTLGSSSGWGTLGLHGRLHAFVKRALLQQLVVPGASVCDLFCGRGTDTANWAQAEIGNYIGIDLSASALEEAKEQWEKHGHPFPATFQELDPCTGNLEVLHDAGLPVDVVSCFAHLQDCFASEGMVRLLLRNVVSLLKPGGYFFGTTPDSSTIWYKYQKAVEDAMKVGSLRVNGTLPRVKSSLYTITFEDDRFQFYGSKYQLRFVDGLPVQMQQLVHFPSFIRVAEEVGLEYVEIQNLTEFYDDYRVAFASTLQSSCKNLLDQKGQPMVDSRGKLSMVATDVLSLYSTFIFRKSTGFVHPTPSLNYHFLTDCHLGGGDDDESSLPETTHGYELTPEITPQHFPPETFYRSSDDDSSCQEEILAQEPTTTVADTVSAFEQVFSQGTSFLEVEYYAENKSYEDRDTIEDFEDVVFESAGPEQDTESTHLEDEVAPMIEESSPASPVKRKELGMNRRRRTARNRRSVSTTSLDPGGQKCSVNYQSEVEQEPPVDHDIQVSVPAAAPPAPFLFYQRKKRGDGVVQEASSFNVSTPELRLRRSSSGGDAKLAPAMARATRSAEAKSLLIATEEARDGDGKCGRGKAKKELAQPRNIPGNERRSTRSTSNMIIQGTILHPETTPESSTTVTTRLTRRSTLRSSF